MNASSRGAPSGHDLFAEHKLDDDVTDVEDERRFAHFVAPIGVMLELVADDTAPALRRRSKQQYSICRGAA